MYKLGTKSMEQFETLHPDIQMILSYLIRYYDFSVLEGHRTKARQIQLHRDGKSKLDGITSRSKHQSLPSMAVDIMPYKKGTNAFEDNEKERARFYTMMGMVKVIAAMLLEQGLITHQVRFGMDWDGDDTFRDQTFDDLPHFELV